MDLLESLHCSGQPLILQLQHILRNRSARELATHLNFSPLFLDNIGKFTEKKIIPLF